MFDQLVCALDTFKCYLNANVLQRHKRFDLSQIPDLSGRVAIVTGGNGGLGYASCLELARHGAKVYMASRTESRAKAAISKIKEEVPEAQIEFLYFDLTILSSAKKAAMDFMDKEKRLDILMNNAGVCMTPYELSPDRIDLQACNCTGHFALTFHLLPILRKTSTLPNSHVRIVNVSSLGHISADKPDFSTLKSLNLESSSGWARYKMSKLCNLLFNNELQKRLKDTSIICLAVHPGFVYTGLGDHLLPTRTRSEPLSSASVGDILISLKVIGLRCYAVMFFWMLWFFDPLIKVFISNAKQGAQTQLYAATSPEIESKKLKGAYLVPYGQLGRKSEYAQDPDGKLGRALWVLCEKLLADEEKRKF
ncbi:hypothetical protein DFH28DRAFT_464746 [Melampsora americana]|nr:hypothetical protein DFH28DRAFT_464746 [Melampsora americana]